MKKKFELKGLRREITWVPEGATAWAMMYSEESLSFSDGEKKRTQRFGVLKKVRAEFRATERQKLIQVE